MELGLVRVSRKASPSIPGSSMLNLMCESMELSCSEVCYLILHDCTVDIINIPEPPLD